MESMYRGRAHFTREQLVFVVDAVLSGAVDRIEACLPPTIPVDEYNKNKYRIEDMIEAHKAVVAITLPILWAQLNDDGMGIAEFVGWDEFIVAVEDYKNNVILGANISPPDMRLVAERFVDTEFKEYLTDSISSGNE
jgi:hypothetical protein